MTEPAIVFVHLGPILPLWLKYAVHQARIFNDCRILVVSDGPGAELADPGTELIHPADLGVSDAHQAFRAISPLDRNFRGGFWSHTTERFFLLDTLMRRLSLSNVLHLENDVMLYRDVTPLSAALAALYPMLGATFDNDQRCVPGLVYVARPDAASQLTSFIVAALEGLSRRLAPHDLAQLNDMKLLAILRGTSPDTIRPLPICPPDYPGPLRSPSGHVAADPAIYSNNFAALGAVFDAAALGQYLGGVDRRNDPDSTAGFINESALIDARVLGLRLIRDAEGRRVPVVETPNGVWPVVNLHIHAKTLEAFLSR